MEKRLRKLLNAARVMGIEAKYHTGTLTAADFKGKRGRVRLAVEKGQNGYRDKNVVDAYLCASTGLIAAPDNFTALVAKYKR